MITGERMVKTTLPQRINQKITKITEKRKTIIMVKKNFGTKGTMTQITEKIKIK